MARRKKTKSRTKRVSFKGGASKKRKQRKTGYRPSLIGILKVLAVVCVLAAAGVGFVFLEKYVKQAVPVSEKIGTVKLVNPPVWVNQTLKDKIYTAARANGEDLKLDEDAAQSVQRNIETLVAWLDQVTVQTTSDSILIAAMWRKPLAVVETALHKSCYVDAELVALDFVPMPNLPIVKVKGLSAAAKVPLAGEVWRQDDLAAAVAVLALFDQRDKDVSPKPLLYEIDRINVSNFNGRRSTRAPHIILYTIGGTKIIWGAEVKAWQRHLEATDEQKIAKLYGYYEEFGSLSGVKYINLCDPQDNIPQPIDKYK